MKNPCNDQNADAFWGVYEKSYEKKKKISCIRRGNTMSLQKECFAYRIGRCAIMTETICRYGTCSFFKTKEQDQLDRQRYGTNKDHASGKGKSI